MRTIFHVVGESDIGVNTSPIKGEEFLEPRRRAVSTWSQRLSQVGDEPARARYLRQPRKLADSGELIDDPDRRATPPLVSLLSGIDTGDEVDLILIGTQNPDGVATVEIAECYEKLLNDHQGLFGPQTFVRVLRAGRFHMDDVAELVRQELDEEEPAEATPVEVSWGSGATELELAVISGVITSGRRWLLLEPRPPYRQVDLVPDLGYPPVVSWLLRYGYPSRVGPALDAAGTSSGDLRSAAQDASRILTSVTNGSTKPEELAAWVRTDARRRSRTWGLAVRAWITAEYRRRRDIDHSPDVITRYERKLVRRGQGWREEFVPLGQIISLVKSKKAYGPALQAQNAPSGQWLVGRAKLVEDAGESAHKFTPLGPARLADLDRTLDGAGELADMADCGPFQLPTGVIAYLWVEGRTSPGRKSALDTVLGAGPAAELREIVAPAGAGAAPPIVADLLIVSTRLASTYANEQAEQARDRDRTAPRGYRFRDVRVAEVEFRGTTDTPIDDPEGLARAAADEWLRARDVDAVVIFPTGNKPQLAGLVSAALAYGHRRAVPVLIQSTNTEGDASQFHRFVPYLATNTPVLEVALASLRTMAFDTAGVLVSLCHPHPSAIKADDLRKLGANLQQINQKFFARQGVNARNRLLLCQRLAGTGTVVDQIRCAHVAAEIYAGGRHRPGTFGPKLVEVRNSLSVNHGARGLEAALAAVAHDPTIPNLQLSDLIGRAARELPFERRGADLVRMFETAETALTTAIHASEASANAPIPTVDADSR